MFEFMRPTGHYFNLERIREDVRKAINLYGWNDGTMIALVHPKGHVQDVHAHTRSKREWPKQFPEGMRMSEWTAFNANMEDGPLHDMWKALRLHFPVARMRLAKLDPGRCYSLHNDEEVRLHYVVDTNPQCLFVISDKPRGPISNMPTYPHPFHFHLREFHTFHMPDDQQVFAMDTNHVHTALNGGTHTRVHIVIETVSELNNRLTVGYAV